MALAAVFNRPLQRHWGKLHGLACSRLLLLRPAHPVRKMNGTNLHGDAQSSVAPATSSKPERPYEKHETYLGQTADTVLMIRPTFFNYNPVTAEDNQYQTVPESLKSLTPEQISSLALGEADNMASVLKENGVHVIQEEPDPTQSDCPDAVFPNNWISFHPGRIALYPMMAESRRKERRKDLIEKLAQRLGSEVVDYSPWERSGKYLEGTGSMVLDRVNKIAYACLSNRTHPVPLSQFCRDFGYTAVVFEAFQERENGELCQVYHTNVVCSVGDTYALLCSGCIRDPAQREMVRAAITGSGKELVEVEEEQVYRFAANSLQVRNGSGKRILVMSSSGYGSLRRDQMDVLGRHVDRIIHSPLTTIESLGGGGARCMLAEVFQ